MQWPTSYIDDKGVADLILWYVLNHIEHGTYLDIGAANPHYSSATKLFYLLGWRGVNIDPHPAYKNLWKIQRPDDTFLSVAVGDVEGIETLYCHKNTYLSTLDPEAAPRTPQTSGIQRQVNVTTLAKICDTYFQDKEIHFLKIDAENYEKKIITGGNWITYRPWVIMNEEWKADCKDLLQEKGYIYASDDKVINHFYVAKEHIELLEKFRSIPWEELQKEWERHNWEKFHFGEKKYPQL